MSDDTPTQRGVKVTSTQPPVETGQPSPHAVGEESYASTLTLKGLRVPKRAGLQVVSFLILGLLWGLAALGLPPTVLPGPLITFETLWANARDGVLWEHFAITMSRIGQGFALAMLIGIVAGTLMALTRLRGFLDLWVMVALTIPSLAYIIISFMWFGLNEFATVVAIGLTAFPAVAINVAEGLKNLDMRLMQMAKTFNASTWRRLSKVAIPQVLPYLMASTRFGLGIVWKVTVIAEFLGRSSGIGFQLHRWFQLFNMPQVFAWTLFFTIIMVLLEVAVLRPLEARLFRWRATSYV